MPLIYKEVEVDVDLEDFDTDELIEELERRGRDYNTQGVDADEMRSLLEQIWIKRLRNRQSAAGSVNENEFN